MGGSSERIWVRILGGVINGCVGAIDDLFQRTLMPRKKDCANNQTAYVSGQYEYYGVNFQGICDVKGRYLFFVPNHQEKQTTHCRLSTLSQHFERCASQYIRCLWWSIWPFQKSHYSIHGLTDSKSIEWFFHFFLNQARIWIELSIARLSGKLGLLYV